MTLGSDIAAWLPTMRTEALSLMDDAGELQAKTGSSIDPDSGKRIDVWTPYWAGRMRIKVTRVDQTVTVGGQQVVIVLADVSVPLDTPLIARGHRVMPVTADPQIVGVPLYIRAVQVGTHLVRRKLATTSDPS